MAQDDFIYYHYTPSLVAAVIFTVVFVLLSLLHTYQLARTRTWFFIPFVIGGLGKHKQEKQPRHATVLTIA